MASAVEDMKSRVGLQLGANGAYQATRTFRVFMDSAGNNPITIIQRSTTTGGLSIGDPHPWLDVPAVLMNFAITDCLHSKLYIVEAIYAPPWLASGYINTGWSFRTQATLETERRFYDLDGKGIGPARYGQRTEDNNIVGPYRAATDRGTAILFLPEFGRGLQLSDPLLYARSAQKRHLVGADRYIPGGSMHFVKVVPQFDTNAIGFANGNVGTVNSDEFRVFTTARRDSVFFGEAGKFMLVGISADPEPTTFYGEATTNNSFPAYRVSVEVSYRRDGWDHSITHTYKTDDGSEAPITLEDGTLVDETFRMQDRLSFSGLMESF